MSEVELCCLTGELRKLLGRNLKAIVLFGSRARGNHTEHCDYDLFVIADELPDDPLDRARIIRSSLLRCPLHTNLTARTPREFEVDLSPLVLDLCVDGQVLYGEDYFEPWRARGVEVSRQADLERRRLGGEYCRGFRNGAPAELELSWEGFRESAA